MEILVFLFAFSLTFGLSGIIVGLIAHFRGFNGWRWFFIGLLLPYISLILVLLWPRLFEHPQG
ncbi:hypothetical protein [Aliidiomarina sanyensis]|uniref:Major facilitator superfamily (MFS) profile domain-containing protein n=1 Tax=Aliidiomarina sanyensis TaxID=1249555 RepID=A0A432WG34_9GAMM|nr:hypothetical protein [Aliidiomarina sanyensis]RUO32786.1 hypothetical protein CWE11_07055 [Aliidiomarina sanyensis]